MHLGVLSMKKRRMHGYICRFVMDDHFFFSSLLFPLSFSIFARALKIFRLIFSFIVFFIYLEFHELQVLKINPTLRVLLRIYLFYLIFFKACFIFKIF